ncbi:hypothetical protein SEUCBS139899_010445 [Sporothrix eucalyptigena]
MPGPRFPLAIPSDSDFPLSNIPFGIFTTDENTTPRTGTAVGTLILDLALVEKHGLFGGLAGSTSFFSHATLNAFAAQPAAVRTAVRARIIELLQDGSSALFADAALNAVAFVQQSRAVMHLPMTIGDFSDFMCAEVHVTNCSKMDNAPGAPPNFFAMPTAYNGRASSVIVSGTPVRRPRGMVRMTGSPPSFAFVPTARIDYELEMGIFISQPVPFGMTISSADAAREHIFGLVMLNDWTARDVQFTEKTPLGPFNGKGSGTTISPWVVTLDALSGAEVAGTDAHALANMATRPPYLRHDAPAHTWNIRVTAALQRDAWPGGPVDVSASNLSALYWTPAQMVAYHASSGCGLRTGDLLGTGTISSPEPAEGAGPGVYSLGCLHELSKAGTQAFKLANGEQIIFVEDGDEVLLRGQVVRADGSTIGFGECRGRIEPVI